MQPIVLRVLTPHWVGAAFAGLGESLARGEEAGIRGAAARPSKALCLIKDL